MELEQFYNCDAKRELFHGISQKPETVEKYLMVTSKLTAISEQTKGMFIWRVYRSFVKILQVFAKKKINQLTE